MLLCNVMKSFHVFYADVHALLHISNDYQYVKAHEGAFNLIATL